MKCSHYGTVRGGHLVTLLDPFRIKECEVAICKSCGAWLSLGPARDTAETEVEVRAAEIAAGWRPIGGLNGKASIEEREGWLVYHGTQLTHVTERGRREASAGFLAAAIVAHDATHDRGDS